MFMKRYAFVLGVLLTLSVSVQAIDRQAIADTLSAITHQHAYVENVCVNRIRVRNNNVSVYTNRALSMVSLSEEEVRDIRLIVSRLVFGNNKGKVSIYTDGYELGELVTARYRHRPKSDRYVVETGTPWVSNQSRAYSAEKGLDGKHIALWGSHGRYYHQAGQRWLWQRAKLWTTVEDVYTSSYVQPFLVPMLENAGAIVVQPRERDTQVREQVVDETEAVVVGTPVFARAEGAGWGRPASPLLEGQNPFAMGTYAEAPSAAKSSSELRYTPSLKEGEYAVYVVQDVADQYGQGTLHSGAQGAEDGVPCQPAYGRRHMGVSRHLRLWQRQGAELREPDQRRRSRAGGDGRCREIRWRNGQCSPLSAARLGGLGFGSRRRRHASGQGLPRLRRRWKWQKPWGNPPPPCGLKTSISAIRATSLPVCCVPTK